MAAPLADRHQSKVSRIETRADGVEPADVRLLLDAYGVVRFTFVRFTFIRFTFVRRATHGRFADSRSRLADHVYGVLDLLVGEVRTGGQPQP